MNAIKTNEPEQTNCPAPALRPALRPALQPALQTAFGCPRNFRENRFVYSVVSARARGLSLGVNMNPDQFCNFDCLYCEVKRGSAASGSAMDVDVMVGELQNALTLVQSNGLRELSDYAALPDELLQLRHVCLSGDGEPTLCPNFEEVVEAVVHIRASRGFPFFKLVLITNATGLHLPNVREGLKYFTAQDEIWAKLDGGTQAYLSLVNRTEVPLETIMANILALGQERPIVIQSLFPAINGAETPQEEIDQYALRLQELKAGGAKISLVQIYSATRPTHHSECGHLPLKTLSRIVHTVRKTTGLAAEVF